MDEQKNGQWPMLISKKFSSDALNDPNKIDMLKREAANYLKKIELSRTKVLSERSDQVLSPDALEQFFRSKERSEKVALTLQYLLTFLSHIPKPDELENEPVNPAEQFREFIRYQVELLQEEDVKNAVFNEVNQFGTLNGGNVWDYQERIINKNRELLQQVAQGGGNTARTIAALCQVLAELCLFWLEVRHGDMQRTRRSDIYLYLLAQVVANRCQQGA